MGLQPLPKQPDPQDLGNAEGFQHDAVKHSLRIFPIAASARKTVSHAKPRVARHGVVPNIVEFAPPSIDKDEWTPYDVLFAELDAMLSESQMPLPDSADVQHLIFAEARSSKDTDMSQPYIVGDWVINSIACIIRSITPEAPIQSIRYPRGTKRRYFRYENGQLVKIETVLGEDEKGETRIHYSKDQRTNRWYMLLDGITSRLPGEISLSETGVFHVQVDDSGRCRKEYPDGNTSIDTACAAHHKQSKAVMKAIASDDGSFENNNHRTVLDLLSVVSHDLRSPLTSVQGLLTLLSAGAFGDIPDKARDRIANVEADLTRLTRLINELLDAEMLVSGKLVMRKHLVDVQDLFDAAVGSLSGLAMQHRIHFAVVKSNLQICADRDRLVRVLVNIVANAIKYSPRGSAVTLSAEFDGSNVILKVTDCGRGIPAKYQNSIFERFQQVSECDWSEKGGAGLGLAISKSIVEAHGGMIGVQSQAGSGSTFWVSLPANAGC